ncbi:MAG: response regulator transcription factor [Chitinophagaceae bacterium]|nr:response regulator transcription factor [Chitinophagaceae bacterium]
MIRAILVDDEQNNIDNLRKLLEKYCPEVAVISMTTSAIDGKRMITEQKPDLIFLDIQMPDKNGFELLKSLNSYSFEVIFVTAFDKYGIQAVKFSAIDYLLKPINIEELKSAVNKAAEKIVQKKQNYQLENLLRLLQQQREEHRIAIPAAKEIRFVKTQDIIRCESSNNYTTFFLNSGEKLIVSKPIYEYEELLSDYGFIRCHQSHLVNKKFVRSIVKEDGGYLLLEDNEQIPVSRQKKEEVKNSLSKK